MRTAVAIVAGLVILMVVLGMFRSLTGPRTGGGRPPLEVAKPPPPGVRVLYWCETCGTEVLLVRAGSEAPPRHCGEPMTRREEVLRDG